MVCVTILSALRIASEVPKMVGVLKGRYQASGSSVLEGTVWDFIRNPQQTGKVSH